tara:strand:- start:3107 stop:3610 length:504 start_codon:yes stop_codon:yes gene_type:complete
MNQLSQDFFMRRADIVAKELLGKTLIIDKKYKARIIETEAYFGKSDPASRASKGKNKISEMMWESPGTIMIYNVHKYKMLNFVTGKTGSPSAVLIRALEPLNFKAKCSGPGLLTQNLKIDNSIHSQNIKNSTKLKIFNTYFKHKIERSQRIGVKQDLPGLYRFYMKE